MSLQTSLTTKKGHWSVLFVHDPLQRNKSKFFKIDRPHLAMSIDSQDSWWKHTGLKLLDSTSGQDYSMYQQCRTEHLDISQHTRKNTILFSEVCIIFLNLE